MANYYVRYPGFGALDGSSWANAYATLAAAATARGAGETFFLADDHAETQSSPMTITFAGTVSNPNFVYCVNRAGSVPPVSADLLTSATITTTGNNAMTVAGSAYFYGVGFVCGSGAFGPAFITAGTSPNTQFWDACAISSPATSSPTINFGGSTGGSKVTLNNTTIGFASTGAAVNVGCDLVWRNTVSAVSGATFPNTFFTPNNGRPTSLLVEGVDLSALGSGKTLVATGGAACNPYTFKDCKLNASLAAICVAPDDLAAPAIQVIRCDSGAVNYRTERYTYAGTQTIETTIVRTGGASDGTTPIAWKIVTTANSKWKFPFECFPISIWNDTTGVSKTVTVEGVWGGGAVPLNDEIWIDVEYLGSSATPLGSFATSTKADGLATGANITSSSETWGGSTTKFKMTATFTPQMKGPITVYVKAAKASSTFYVDPKITVA